jgi:hypothetical protein
MAEEQKAIAGIPIILEVAEVEVPITVGIPIQVRHPMVTV